MNEEEALLAGILAEPENRLRQLVYADYLDERGRHFEALMRRAEWEGEVYGTYRMNILEIGQLRPMSPAWTLDGPMRILCRAHVDGYVEPEPGLESGIRAVLVRTPNDWVLCDLKVDSVAPTENALLKVTAIHIGKPKRHGPKFNTELPPFLD